MQDRLIIFTRLPDAGRTKTRLIPAVGAAGAAWVQQRLTEQAAQTARRARERCGCAVIVYSANNATQRCRDWLGADLGYRAQEGADLGERMHAAFIDAFRDGCDRVLLIGSDCPQLTASIVQRGFEALVEHDLVLGPANDGGYYLIGLRRKAPALFRDIPWGGDAVFERTMTRARAAQLGITQLPVLGDVDRPEDLALAARELGPIRPAKPSLSVVVPALNEAEGIADTIMSTRFGSDVELIVADGGSADATTSIAGALGARVLCCERGRGRQMNAGADTARADTLLFLHADSCLPPLYRQEIAETLAPANIIAGAFPLRLHDGRLSLRLIAGGANLRSRIFQLPYGDQGLFLRSATFHRVGGFGDLPVMEDYDLIERLRRRGRVRLARSAIVSSARRWTQAGVLRTTLRHQQMILAWRLGVEPRRIAAWRA
jgi:hypothetical protein